MRKLIYKIFYGTNDKRWIVFVLIRVLKLLHSNKTILPNSCFEITNSWQSLQVKQGCNEKTLKPKQISPKSQNYNLSISCIIFSQRKLIYSTNKHIVYTLVFAFFFLYFLPNNVGIFPLDYIFLFIFLSLLSYNKTQLQFFLIPPFLLALAHFTLLPDPLPLCFLPQKSRHSLKDESKQDKIIQDSQEAEAG